MLLVTGSCSNTYNRYRYFRNASLRVVSLWPSCEYHESIVQVFTLPAGRVCLTRHALNDLKPVMYRFQLSIHTWIDAQRASRLRTVSRRSPGVVKTRLTTYATLVLSSTAQGTILTDISRCTSDVERYGWGWQG